MSEQKKVLVAVQRADGTWQKEDVDYDSNTTLEQFAIKAYTQVGQEIQEGTSLFIQAKKTILLKEIVRLLDDALENVTEFERELCVALDDGKVQIYTLSLVKGRVLP